MDKKNSKYLQVLDHTDAYDVEEGLTHLLSDLDRLIPIVEKLKEWKKLGNTYTVDIETEYGYYDDRTVYLRIKWYRLETAEEYHARMELAKKRSLAAKKAARERKIKEEEEEERALLEKLKKKYEK